MLCCTAYTAHRTVQGLLQRPLEILALRIWLWSQQGHVFKNLSVKVIFIRRACTSWVSSSPLASIHHRGDGLHYFGLAYACQASAGLRRRLKDMQS